MSDLNVVQIDLCKNANEEVCVLLNGEIVVLTDGKTKLVYFGTEYINSSRIFFEKLSCCKDDVYIDFKVKFKGFFNKVDEYCKIYFKGKEFLIYRKTNFMSQFNPSVRVESENGDIYELLALGCLMWAHLEREQPA